MIDKLHLAGTLLIGIDDNHSKALKNQSMEITKRQNRAVLHNIISFHLIPFKKSYPEHEGCLCHEPQKPINSTIQ